MKTSTTTGGKYVQIDEIVINVLNVSMLYTLFPTQCLILFFLQKSTSLKPYQCYFSNMKRVVVKVGF